jgi:hypothetical protein
MMPILDEMDLAAKAEQRSQYRLKTVATKLSSRELRDLEALAARREQTPAGLIRQLILGELAKDGEPPSADPLLSEIIGVRLLLVNLLKPHAAGEKPLTLERFEAMLSEIQKVKKQLALKVQEQLENR